MFSPNGLGQTIAVFDKSGKAVGTSKQILNVFKEAKAAYQQRKAELVAARTINSKPSEAPRLRRAHTTDDVTSVTSSRRSDRSRHQHREPRHKDRPRETTATTEPGRRHSDSLASGEKGLKVKEKRIKITPQASPGRSRSGISMSPSTERPLYSPGARGTLARHGTYQEDSTRSSGHLTPRRTRSSDDIDMDLAYGDPPPNLMTIEKRPHENELIGLVGRAEFLLDEAKCLQSSVQSIIATLQKNPEAMAAVALTLGEISALVKKMSPGALAKIKFIAPSVFALLRSPQFLVAAGVGVGVTVIALGGYKIIKKMQAKKEDESPEQMIALGSEVSRIETWRQGIAEAETASVGTSIDGEFITPMAANLSRLDLAEARSERSRQVTPSVGQKSARTVRSVKSSRQARSRDSVGVRSVSTTKESRSSKDKDKDQERKRSRPKPSPLRSLFSS